MKVTKFAVHERHDSKTESKSGISAFVYPQSERTNEGQSDITFSSLLSSDIVKELGDEDPYWFGDLSVSPINECSSSTVRNYTPRIYRRCRLSDAAVHRNVHRSISEQSTSSDSCNFFSTPKSGHEYVFGFSPPTQVFPIVKKDPTPVRIALSLGATYGDHELSWTASMATPLLGKVKKSTPSLALNNSDEKKLVQPKSLFKSLHTEDEDSEKVTLEKVTECANKSDEHVLLNENDGNVSSASENIEDLVEDIVEKFSTAHENETVLDRVIKSQETEEKENVIEQVLAKNSHENSGTLIEDAKETHSNGVREVISTDCDKPETDLQSLLLGDTQSNWMTLEDPKSSSSSNIDENLKSSDNCKEVVDNRKVGEDSEPAQRDRITLNDQIGLSSINETNDNEHLKLQIEKEYIVDNKEVAVVLQDIAATQNCWITLEDPNSIRCNEHLKLPDYVKDIVDDRTSFSQVVPNNETSVVAPNHAEVHCQVCCSQGWPKSIDGEPKFDAFYVLLNDIPPGMYQLTYSDDFPVQYSTGEAQQNAFTNDRSMSEVNSLEQDSVQVDKNITTCAMVNSIKKIVEGGENVNKSDFKGFSTANGKAVKISDDAIKRARRLFEDVLPVGDCLDDDHNQSFRLESFTKDDSISNNISKNINDADDKTLTSFHYGRRDGITGMCGFSTAKGKPINVSTDALKKARELWNDADFEHSSLAAKSSVLFEDASSNNSSRVQNKLKCKKLITNDFQSTNVEKLDSEVNVPPIPNRVGFCTGAGKLINVCDESLTKAKKLFDFIETDSNINCHSGFGGFQTATGKKIAVSEEAFLKAKQILLVDEDEDGFSKPKASTPTANSSTRNSDVFNSSLKKSGVYSCNLHTPEHRVPISRKRLATGENASSRSSCSSAKTEISVEDWEIMVADFLEDEAIDTASNSVRNSVICYETGNVSVENEIHLSTAALLADETEADGSNCWPSSQTTPVTKSKRKGLDLSTTPRRSKRLRVKGGQVDSQRRNNEMKERADRLMYKLHSKVKPVMGSLWELKHSNKKIPLKEFVGVRPSCLTVSQLIENGLKISVLNVNCSNAEEFCFSLNELSDVAAVKDGLLKMSCGAVLAFNEDDKAGKSEFQRAFLDAPGIDPNLISEKWVFNHYRWIIWKLASLEMKFPDVFGEKLLTPDVVMNQLQYRYNCEIDHSQRSAIKKLFEQDDTPSKTMILCVASCYKDSSAENGVYYLELTDGWYLIRAIIDDRLSKLIHAKKIFVGAKLIIFGCEFSKPFNACDPLEIPANVTLQLNANSCRRARWDAKLGFKCSPLPSLSIKSLYADGGRVPAVSILVARVFPMQYLEKKPDGAYCVYNDRTNDRAARMFEAERNTYLEELSKKFSSEFEEQDSRRRTGMSRSYTNKCNLSREQIENLNSGEEINDLLEVSNDPSTIESFLSEHQKSQVINYKQSLNDKRRVLMEKEIVTKGKAAKERNVVPFVKFVAVDEKSSCYCNVTIWKPSPDLDSLLKEGKKLKAFNLCADNRRSESELNLKSTKQTRFTEIKDDTIIAENVFIPRKLTSFKFVGGDFQPVYGIVDIIGVVIKSRLKEQGRFDCVYVADANMDIISLKFWDGLKAFSLEDVLIPETFILATNLQWRGKILSPIQCLYATEISCFTQRPRDSVMRSALDELEKSVTQERQFYARSIDKITELLRESPYGRLSINAGASNIGKPVSSSTPIQRYKNVPGNLGGGSFIESPISANTPTSRRVDQKYKTLQKYGDPPPSLSLSLSNSSYCKKPFKPPLKC